MAIMLLTNNCGTLVVKPNFVPYDYDLDQAISDRLDKIVKKDVKDQKTISDQLNDYETLRQKSKKAIELNNKRAL